MTTEKSGQYSKTPRGVLSDLFDKYMDYVQSELNFDANMKEIVDFGEWAESHYAIPKEEAENFFYDYAEGDGGTASVRAA